MIRNTVIKHYKKLLLDILVDFYNFRPKVGRKNKYNLHTYINYIFRVFFFGEKSFLFWRNLGDSIMS